ncbi:MAG: polyamine aminopropyltransferase [Bernardetiaceae bacterium]|nr:polyamine aminopropyltransferase [Bernardetiaceae bacterium]
MAVKLSISQSNILKVALFATGVSGIVAEYILSTLATYFLGDSVFQWTMTVSVMLFAMGLGSRISKYIRSHLLEVFVLIEFLLSIVVSFSALIVYVAATYIESLGILIYSMSILVGMMIGLEIPLVTRINETYEDLRENISSVMEKDYFGSLLGGVFFAFVGLPILGLTYTPFILGFINFAVAIFLYIKLHHLVSPTYKKALNFGAIFVAFLVFGGAITADPIIQFGEQSRYRDKVIFEKQTRYQKIIITQWQHHYWLYLNSHLQFSTLDEYLYHEPLVHPVMGLSKDPREVLVLGGGDGCAVRELLKYGDKIEKIMLVDLDPAMTDLGKNHHAMVEVNQNALHDPKVEIINQDAFSFLLKNERFFDVIIVDFPDPKTIDLNRLYSREFYEICYQHLRPEGLMITQAGSPYYATRAFECINLTMQAAGFATARMHNQVLTMGQWGWVVGAKNIPQDKIKTALRNVDLTGIQTRWLTSEGLLLITSFGKDLVPIDEIEVNSIQNPVLYKYYDKGNWDLY